MLKKLLVLWFCCAVMLTNVTYPAFAASAIENTEVAEQTIENFGAAAQNMTVENDAVSLMSSAEVVSVAQVAEFAGGSGTVEDPYQVATPNQLALIDSYPDKSYVLINNIELTEDWTPVCTESAFSGNLDGNGFAVSNVNISKESVSATSYSYSYYYVGLIGINEGTITNLNVQADSDGIVISRIEKSGYASATHISYVGGIVAKNGGVISNCSFNGKVRYSSSIGYVYAGGVAGYSSSSLATDISISRCHIEADVSALSTSAAPSYSNAYVGGIVGYQNSGTIKHCYIVNSTVDSDGVSLYSTAYAGGIVGYASGTVIEECFASGTVVSGPSTSSGTKSYAGGITGYNGTIENCFALGDVTAKSNSAAYAGGITGYDSPDKVSISYYYGNITTVGTGSGSSNAGGIIAYASSTDSPGSCYYYGEISATSETGVVYSGSVIGRNTSNKSVNLNRTIEQMQQKSNYTSWDFEHIWDIDSNINNGMPYLRNVPTLKISISVNSIHSTEFKTLEEISGIIFVALYDNENRLLETKTYPAAESITATLDKISLGKYIKVMWWEGWTLTPLSSVKKIDL